MIHNSKSISLVIYFLFTFHSRYSTLSFSMLYLALENGIPIFIQSCRLHITYLILFFSYNIVSYLEDANLDYHHLRSFYISIKCSIEFHNILAILYCIYKIWLILFHSPLLQKSRLISFPVGTKMF